MAILIPRAAGSSSSWSSGRWAHGFDVHAVARDTRGLLVLGHHLVEAGGVTGGVFGHLGAVGARFFQQAQGLAGGARHHVVGVGFALALGAFVVLAGLVGVVERALHLLRRLNALHGHVADLRAERVAVEDLLHQQLGVERDFFAADVQDVVHLALAHDFADRGLGDLAHRLIRLQIVEQPRFRVLQGVLHRELDVDDVLVIGQHQRFFEVLRAHVAAVADLDRAHFVDVDLFVGLERVRHAPVQARTGAVAVFAEGRDDAGLAFAHAEHAAGEPDEADHRHRRADRDAGALHVGPVRAAIIAAARTLVAEHAVEALVEVAPHLVEIGRAVTGTFAVLQQDSRRRPDADAFE